MPLPDAYILDKLNKAKLDRGRRMAWINDTLRFASPLSPRLDTASESPIEPDQDDLFDRTLQETVDDFGSDMNHLFTPRHERWVRLQPVPTLSPGEQRQIDDLVQKEAEALFADIEQSNFYAAAGEAYRDLSISVMAVSITDPGASGPIDVQHIDMSALLLARGPRNTFDGRFRQWPPMRRGDLHVTFPGAFAPVSEGTNKGEANKMLSVVDGWVRNWSDPTIEAWEYVIIVAGRVEHRAYFRGAGSCGFIVCPWRKSTRTAWMPGPAHKALPPARVLDELTYLYLKQLNRDVDPPMSYVEDGVMNPEGGVDAGVWLARAPGSDAPQALTSNARLDAAVFERDRLQMQIKKALYQDRPEQAGRTPPTATQWADERAWNTRRMELPRDLVTQEWVIPIINRFGWIRAMRGAMTAGDMGAPGPAIMLDKRLVALRPVTPLSKARDVEDIQVTLQVLSLAQQLSVMDQSGTPIDSRATLEAVIKTAMERHIALKSEEQIAQERMAAMIQQSGIDPNQIAAAMGGQGGAQMG